MKANKLLEWIGKGTVRKSSCYVLFTPTHSTELGQLSGVDSILRFSLPEPDDSDQDD